MSKFRIVMTGHGRGEVFRDGVPVQGVKAIEFRGAVGEQNTVTLTFGADEVEIQSEADGQREVTDIGDDARKYARA